MKSKNLKAEEKILYYAKQEFMQKGFDDASMRTIAEKAGFTTGMLYSRFADKNELFSELVKEGADKLYSYFTGAQEEFASFCPEKQAKEMHEYTHEKMLEMIDVIYDYFDAFRLIVCKSAGSGYERYIDTLIEIETRSTVRFIDVLQKSGAKVRTVRQDLNHILASAMFNGIFEIVAHEFTKEDALGYVRELCAFFDAGWDRLLGM